MRNPSARPDILTGRPWLLAIGRLLEVEYPALEQPVPERLAALLKKLEGPSAVSPQRRQAAPQRLLHFVGKHERGFKLAAAFGLAEGEALKRLRPLPRPAPPTVGLPRR
jgi:hypothetical protein